MFYIVMYGLLAFGSITILTNTQPLMGDISVLLATFIIFFIMYKRYIKDLGGIDKAKAYYKRLLNINSVEEIDVEEVVVKQEGLDPQLEYEQARAELVKIAYKQDQSTEVVNDGSEVVINDDRFFVSNKRWSLLLFIFFTSELITMYLSNWSFYIFSLINFALVFIIMTPFVIESLHGIKKTGLKKFLKWVVFGVVAIYALNIINNIIFEWIDFLPDSGNQEAVIQMLKDNFFRVAFEVTFTAAIFEEFVFRGVFFRNLYSKNKWLAYFVTFIAFGIPHLMVGFIDGAGMAEFMFLPLYGGMGVIFAYIYVKTDSIFTAMGAHFINNLISIIMITFL